MNRWKNVVSYKLYKSKNGRMNKNEKIEKFLAAAVLGVMVSVTPAGAYAASTETSPLPVNSESDTVAQAEDEENDSDSGAN